MGHTTRRSFVATSVTAASLVAAGRLFGAPASESTRPSPELEKLGAIALAEAKKQGATYSDIRIGRYRNQFSGYRLSPQRGSNITDEVPFVTDQNSFGFGVRVIASGQWGTVPVALDEAARIDGCSRLQSVIRVLLPVMLPGLASTAIL